MPPAPAAFRKLPDVYKRQLYPFVTFLLTVGTFFVIYFGGASVLGGRMTPGQLTQFVAYAGMLYGPLGFLSRLPRMLMQLTNSLERIYEILDEESDLEERKNAGEQTLKGEIVFKDVTLSLIHICA